MSSVVPGRYEIRVDGHLDNRWHDWLGDVTLHRGADGVTTISTPVTDQAQLHGLLAAVRDLNATLLSVRVCAPIPPPVPLLRTARLWLRPATSEDAEATWTYRRLDSVNEWLTGTSTTYDEYAAQFSAPERLPATVVVTLARAHDAQPAVIGDLMLRREDSWAQVEVADQARGQQAELGWVVDPRHTGQGYATEAVTELIRYCFEDLSVHRLVANCFLANETSWRLMERVGMRRESHAVRESLHRSGRWLDTVTYALLGDEWRPRSV